MRLKSSSRSSGSRASGAGGGPIGTARSSACWSCAPRVSRTKWPTSSGVLGFGSVRRTPDLPTAEAPEVPPEIRNGLDLSMKGGPLRNEGPLSCHDLAAAPISVHDEAKALHRDVAANVGDGHPKAVATRRDLHSLHVEPVNR